MVARVQTVAFQGVEAVPVDVQVMVAPGKINMHIVGLPDKAVAESRERVQAALHASGLSMPAKKVTINLAPADLPKEGSHYDLPIALGLMAALGVFLSGYLADRLARRYPTALSWMPALGMGVSVPLYWIGYLSPTIPMMIPPLMAAATLHYFYLGAMYAVATGVADSRTRATSVALTLFVVNLIGIGLGPTVIGFLSTFIKSAMLGGSDLGLTIAICKDAGNLAPDAAAACTGATAKALQWAIVIFATLYGWAALHYHWAGKTLQRDMITRAA